MKYCKQCGKDVPRISNYANNVKFCNPYCRTKYAYWHGKKEKIIAARNEKAKKPSPDKLQCLFCDQWYVKVASHVFYIHHLTEDQYKSYFDLPLSKGIIPAWHKEKLRMLALDNKMDKQLARTGTRTRYKKGDKRAKLVTGWKGRTGQKGFTDY